MSRAVLVVALLVTASGLGFAQEFTEYQNIQDGFKILFPGPPTVTTGTWKSEHDFMLPQRVYGVDRGGQHYSVTVVDYSGIEQMGLERAKKCPAGAEPCLGSDLAGIGYWKHDVRGAIIYATLRFMKRDATVTDLSWNQQDLVEGHQIQLTNRADGSRTEAFITMHEMKLFIAEATVPKGYPEPALFVTSMGWVDKDGNGIRYQTIYNNEFHGMRVYPVPGHGGGGGGAGRGGGGGGGGGDRRGGGPGTGQP